MSLWCATLNNSCKTLREELTKAPSTKIELTWASLWTAKEKSRCLKSDTAIPKKQKRWTSTSDRNLGSQANSKCKWTRLSSAFSRNTNAIVSKGPKEVAVIRSIILVTDKSKKHVRLETTARTKQTAKLDSLTKTCCLLTSLLKNHHPGKGDLLQMQSHLIVARLELQ